MAKTLHYDFKSNPSLEAVVGPALGITRNSKGTMKDADGWLREVQIDEARFPGATFSQNISNTDSNFYTGWTDGGINTTIFTQNAAVAPDGTTTATLLEDDGAGGLATVRALGGGTEYRPLATTCVVSFYAKPGPQGNITHCAMDFGGMTFPSVGTVFDLGNIAVGDTESGVVDVGIEDAGNGWRRCWIAYDAEADDSYNIQVQFHNSTTLADNQVPRDGTSDLLLWGFQFEEKGGAWDSQNLVLNSEPQSAADNNPELNVTYPTVTTPAAVSSSIAVLTSGSATAYAYGWGGTIDLTQVAGRDVIASAFVKLTDGTEPTIATSSGATGNFNFNFGGTFIPVAGSEVVTPEGDGWYRCSAVYRLPSTYNGANTGLIQFAAQGDYDGRTDVGCYWVGFQVEVKKPAQTGPGAYTPTTTAAVTNYSPSTYIPTTTAAVSSLSGANDGLLVEEARTNICLQSEDFTTTWSSTRLAATANQTIAPDGSLTAELLTQNFGAAASAFINQSVTVASGANTFSAFVKADVTDWVMLNTGGFDASGAGNSFFDLANGVVGTKSANHDSSGIEDYGNGWYRVWVTFTTTTDLTGAPAIYLAEADNDFNVPDGSSIFVWGAQLEAGAFPTSYIPTTTGTVTRNADVVRSTDISWYNEDEGTLYANMISSVPADNASDRYAVSIGSAGNNQLALGFRNVGNTLYGIHETAVGTDGASPTETYVPDTDYKISIGYQSNDLRAYSNGNAGNAVASVTVPASTAYDEFYVGANAASIESWCGLIKEVRYYDERFDDTVLQAMSTGDFSGTNSDDDFFLRRRKIARMKQYYGRLR